MAATKTMRATFAYNDTTFTRQYDIELFDDDAATTIKEKAIAINASITAGTDNGFSSFFVSDDGKHMKEISDLKLITVEETVLNLD